MLKLSNILTSGTTGEITRRLEGRVDLSKYYSAFRTLKNFFMYPHGPITKTEGTYYVAECKHRDKTARYIPFKFSIEQAYQLEFGDQYMRVDMNGGSVVEDAVTISGATQAEECVVTATAHGYADGDEIYIDGIVGMTELNGKRYRVSDKDANTFKIKDLAGDYIDSTGFGAYTSDGSAYRVYEISTPYLEADLFELQFTQSADIMYITHGDYPTYKLSRTGHTSWTLEEVDWIDGPYLPEQAATHGITPSATLGSVTLNAGIKSITGATQAEPVVITSNAHGYADGDCVYITGVVGMTQLNAEWYVVRNPDANTLELYDLYGNPVDGTGFGAYVSGGYLQEIVFSSGDTNRLIRFFCTGSVYRWAKITAYTNSHEVTATIKGDPLPDANEISNYRMGYFSDGNGYAYACTFHEQRLILGGCPAYPNTIWGSISGADSFENFTPGSTESDPIIYTLMADQVNAIRWLSAGKVLSVGCADAEWTLCSNSLNEPITPTNITAKKESNKGGAYIKPIRIDRSIFYVQRTGRKLFEFAYKYTEDGDSYISTDVTLLAEHITKSGIVAIDYQQEPDSIIWCVLANGTLIGLTYQKEHDVVGWFQVETDGYVESVSCIPGEDHDEVWIIVKRTVDSVVRRYKEYFNPSDYEDDITDAFFVHSGLTYEGEATDDITGAEHLEGETVDVLADGAPTTRTISSGSFDTPLEWEATKIHIGKNYTSLADYLRPEPSLQQGTIQAKKRRLVGLVLRVLNTLGGQVGPDADNLDDLPYEWGDLGEATPLFSGDIPVKMPTGYDREGRFRIVHELPLPITVVAAIPDYAVGEET